MASTMAALTLLASTLPLSHPLLPDDTTPPPARFSRYDNDGVWAPLVKEANDGKVRPREVMKVTRSWLAR